MVTRFHPRGRLDGTVILVCPDCGRVNRHRVTPHVWKVICGNTNCKVRYGISLLIWEIPRGTSRLPWDRTLPSAPYLGYQDALPRVPMLKGWRSGEPMNRYVPRKKGPGLLRMVKGWRKWYRSLNLNRKEG